MDVTKEQLVKALDHAWVYAANHDGTHHAQIVTPDQVADDLWEKLAAQEPDDDPASVRHIVDTADPELSAMAVITAALDDLDMAARGRVLVYVADRFGLDL